MNRRRDKIPQSVLSRTSRLLLSGAKIAAREVAGRLGGDDSKLANKIRQTEELVATLSQLKGAAMKAGQLVSLEFSDILPPEVVAILRQLHDSSTFMPFDQVRYILSRELGPNKLSELEDLSPQPIAAASIGQVHRATLQGREVAVKVQFPGVDKSIDSDLAIVRRIVNIGIQLRGKTVDIDPMFSEIASGLKKEADYLLEAANVESYRSKITGQGYIIPTVYHDYTTKQVLCLSYESGERIGDWIKTSPSEESVEHFSKLIINLLIDELFTHGFMQTDPNFGNFLYRSKEGRLVLLDFGATNAFSKDLRQLVRQLLKSIFEQRFDEVMELIFANGYLSGEESRETVDLFLQLIQKLTYMFQAAHQPFHYRDEAWLKDIRELITKFALSVQYSAPPHQLFFLNRKLSGMFHLLKELDLKMDMTSFLQRALEIPII